MQLNWIGYKFIKTDGYGRFNMGFIKALIKQGVKVYPDTIDVLEYPGWFQRAKGLEFGKTTIQCMPAHEMKSIPGRLTGFSMWEAEGVPDGWIDILNDVPTYVLVPCEWFKGSLINQGVKTPIHVMPGGIDPFECEVLPQNNHRPFTFGCWGDRGTRKGMDLVWMAFYKAFGKSKDVRLLIKCRPPSLPYMDLAHSDSRISLWREDADDIGSIFSQMDCFVFPTRGEGFGMPPREAAACAIPTICTNWAGTADNIENWAIPLNKYEFGESPLPGKGQWANPDVDEIVSQMRWVYDNQDQAKQDALIRAEWLRRNLTWEHAAKRLIDFTKKHI